MSNTAVLVGSILGVIIPIIFWVSLIVCCVFLCCLCYKKCGKRHNRRTQTVTTTTVVYAPPQHSLYPPGYQPSCPGYQPVPAQPGYVGPPNPAQHGYVGPPNPAAPPPPSYLEATDPAHSTVTFIPVQPVHPSQPHALPPHSEEPPLPFNPTNGPKK